MPSREEVTSFMAKYFPTCPICGSDAGYEISGSLKLAFYKDFIRCKSCRAYWKSKDFRSLKELKELALWKESNDGKGWSLKYRFYPLDFWKYKVNEILEEEAEMRPTIRKDIGKRAQFIAKYLPICPLCGSTSGYEDTSGKLIPTVQCRTCKAKWTSNPDLIEMKELRKLKLWEPSRDGKGSTLKGKDYPIDFWREYSSKEIKVPQTRLLKVKKALEELEKLYKKEEISNRVYKELKREYELELRDLERKFR